MNLTLLLDMAADGFGDRRIVGRGDTAFTAGTLRDLSSGGADLFREVGARAVIYLGVNGPAFPLALFAAARAGIPLVPLNYRLSAEALTALVANHPDAYGIAGAKEAELLRDAGVANVVTTEEWLEKAAARAAEVGEGAEPVESDAPAVLIYTSGTTSAPKGVVLRHHNLVSYVLGTVEFASADAEEACLISVPPYHIAAVANAISNLYAGRRTIVLEQFTPVEWLEVARQENVTHAMVVPTMLSRIMEADDAHLAVPTLRSLAYGGASMPAVVIERALTRWPDVAFVNAYGLTETSSTIAVLGPDDHRAAIGSDDPAVRARLSSAGRIVPSIELQVRDFDGRPAPPGVPGRIWVRGDQVSGEYAGSGTALDDDGWFDTRDQGYLDADGYLFIGGRADDTIIRGAENIAPAEIEEVLLRHGQVADAVVVGIPDDEWGQRIEAAVVRRTGSDVDADELRAYVRSHLRGSKTPERIVFWSELPRTETGKLVRRRAVERIVRES
ncbi:class I adenylate-forming enzyme family protein [Cryptosporangium aurantiacum]|uniref:Acyl-CoA synthetase (AMP-forming)/AMP-acid ligase II n=1 Tax=Cryptosporangium aurantiacum TaxID=134849 RepID=A0A1M7PI42_9ACTN|nr:fatty acid--CoA ligase family protein [Cryptosporangium aurantiacum]SHN16688.1 Acyl-CoA synthetase (AMP-forming)/AMP-acid ligase II [Cryptosporangium aurantiacum]